MKQQIVILAALPREVMPLVRNWPVSLHLEKDGAFLWQRERVTVVCAGMGPERVTHALNLAETHAAGVFMNAQNRAGHDKSPFSFIFSVGYAGALRPKMATDRVYRPATVIDAATGDRFVCDGADGDDGILVTADHVVHAEEKLQLATQWKADLVDMESATVARLAFERNLPFGTLRVISDEAAERLPDLGRFTDANGGFREASFALHVLLHPWLIPAAIRMGKRASRGANLIAETLRPRWEQSE